MQTTRRIRRTYYTILSLFWLATALPMSLNILFIQSRGIDLFQVGVLMGVYSLTIVLLEVPTGGLADAIGRKRVAIIAYGCLSAASIAFLFTFSFPIALGAFALYGAGRALSSGALDAWFVDALQAADPQTDLQPALAKADFFTYLSLGLGTLLGSSIPLLFAKLPSDAGAVLTPLSMPIVIAIAIKVVLMALTFLWVEETPAAGHSANWEDGFRQVPAIVRAGFKLGRSNPTFLLILGATSASGFALAGLESFWQPNFAELLGGSQGKSLFFGLVMGGNFLVGMFGSLLATPLSRIFNKRYGLLCAIFQGAWGAAILMLARQTAPAPAVLLFWMAYLNMGFIASPHNTLLNGEILSSQRSSMLSIASLASYAGAVLGSTGLGYLAEHASISAAWTLAGLVLMVSLGLYWKIDSRQTRESIHLHSSTVDV